MNNKTVKLLIAIIAIIIGGIYYYFTNQSGDGPHSSNFAQRSLSYTKHARCRMDCRGVTEAEIKEVLREGRQNAAKSDNNDKPCPSYAFEDRVQDGQMLRVVVGDCGIDQPLKVITCIDLEQEHDCDCP